VSLSKYFSVLGLLGAMACSPRKADNSQDSTSMTRDSVRTAKSINDSIKYPERDSIDYEKAMRIESYLIPKPQDSKETTVINQTCAIFTYPDDNAIEVMKKKYGDDFYIIADDVNWYCYESGQILDSLKVTRITVNTRYIEFVGSVKSYFLDTQAIGGPGWNLFFLHSKKEPKIVSMVGLSSDSVRTYFDTSEKP
jgi:hypothetical protein